MISDYLSEYIRTSGPEGRYAQYTQCSSLDVVINLATRNELHNFAYESGFMPDDATHKVIEKSVFSNGGNFIVVGRAE